MSSQRSLKKLNSPRICLSCRLRLLHPSSRRAFTTTPTPPADFSPPPPSDGTDLFAAALKGQKPRQQDRPAARPRPSTSTSLASIGRSALAAASSRPATSVQSENEPYHLNVYAHKHNMHITFTRPSRDPILSFSAGNLGLKKAQRSTFDAAYQLAGYTMRKMTEKNWREKSKTVTMANVLQIEVVMRGYGPGREAFQKALLGPEGRLVKGKVVKVTDATRLKFGGVRSPNVRRLG